MTRYLLFVAFAVLSGCRYGVSIPDCDSATTVCPGEDTDPVYPRGDSGETDTVDTDTDTAAEDTDSDTVDTADTDTATDTDPPPPIDSDGDGYTTFTDCDDGDPGVNPGAAEQCNSVDDDCDLTVDEGAGITSYADLDGDGFGAAASSHTACSVPSGYVTNATDCDDASAAVNPSGTESCNNADDDCDGSVDEGYSTSTYYLDSDSDGFGTASSPFVTCLGLPSGYVVNSTDCNDASAAVSPLAAEACNGSDDDCDGAVDDACQ